MWLRTGFDSESDKKNHRTETTTRQSVRLSDSTELVEVSRRSPQPKFRPRARRRPRARVGGKIERRTELSTHVQRRISRHYTAEGNGRR
jgi:hypothetical protein